MFSPVASPSSAPILKSSEWRANNEHFLSFLNPGSHTNQNTSEEKSIAADMPEQKSGEGLGFIAGTERKMNEGLGFLAEAERKKQRIEERRVRKLQELREKRRQERKKSAVFTISNIAGGVASSTNTIKESDCRVDSALPALEQEEHIGLPSSKEVPQNEPAAEPATDQSHYSSDESPFTPAEELVIIDPEGDIRVTVGTIGKEITALCSSSCLRRASPKWKALIQASPTEIHLEGDTELVSDLLRIAHAQFSGLPTRTYFNELLEFARICHIYETTELIRPWQHLWVDPWAKMALDPGYEGFVFIAWIFGYMDTFSVLTHRLASFATSSNAGIPDDVPIMFDEEMRTTIVDNIFRIRNAGIDDMIAICHDEVAYLLDVATPRACYACEECERGLNVHSDLCDLIAIASLQRGLKTIKLWPPYPAPKTSHMTIQGLQTQLDDLRLLSYPGHEEEYHQYCNANANFHYNLSHKRKEVHALQVCHKEHFESFRIAVPRNYSLVWKSKAVEDMSFLEREIRSNDLGSEDDESFPDPDPDYDEDEDEDYEEWESESDSEPDEEYLEPGEESDYTSDVEEDPAPKAYPRAPVSENASGVEILPLSDTSSEFEGLLINDL